MLDADELPDRTGAERLKSLVDDLVSHPESADLRERVRSLLPVLHELRAVGKALLPEDADLSGRDRILKYLQRYPLTVIEGDELLLISGIGDWARRVRELRVQRGWAIFSGVTFKEMAADAPEVAKELATALNVDPATLRTDHYVLMSAERDREAADRWHLLNSIRKLKRVSVKERILRYLRENVGRPVTSEELRYLAGNASDWPRRTRELRTVDGWPVFTSMQGRPDLAIGTYVLDEDRQAPPHDRRIKDEVRIKVLERDGYACTACGWTRERARPDDPRKRLEPHHLIEHAKKGSNDADNLTTLCNVDHDRVHAGRLENTDGKWRAVEH